MIWFFFLYLKYLLSPWKIHVTPSLPPSASPERRSSFRNSKWLKSDYGRRADSKSTCTIISRVKRTLIPWWKNCDIYLFLMKCLFQPYYLIRSVKSLVSHCKSLVVWHHWQPGYFFKHIYIYSRLNSSPNHWRQSRGTYCVSNRESRILCAHQLFPFWHYLFFSFSSFNQSGLPHSSSSCVHAYLYNIFTGT